MLMNQTAEKVTLFPSLNSKQHLRVIPASMVLREKENKISKPQEVSAALDVGMYILYLPS